MKIKVRHGFRKSAEQGYAPAQVVIGFLYQEGKLVGKNDIQALMWLRKAAQQNDAKAEFYLGEVYEDGKGVVKDKQQAISWYRKSSEHGFEPAHIALKRLLKYARKKTECSKKR